MCCAAPRGALRLRSGKASPAAPTGWEEVPHARRFAYCAVVAMQYLLQMRRLFNLQILRLHHIAPGAEIGFNELAQLSRRAWRGVYCVGLEPGQHVG